MDDHFWMLSELAAAKETIDKQANEIVKLRREVSKLRKATEWQPIETYRKGVVILFHPEQTGRNALSEWIRTGTPADTPFRKPTHWMPLPNTPAVEGES